MATLAMKETMLKDNRQIFLLWRIKVTHSVKNPYYYSYTAFDADTGVYVPALVSGCTCLAGTEFRSHQLGFLGLFYIVTNCVESNYEQVTKCLPKPVQSIQSLPIPFEYAFQKGKNKDNQPDGNESCDKEIDEETVSEDDESEDKNREDINNNKDETITNNKDLEHERVEQEHIMIERGIMLIYVMKWTI